MRFQATSTLAIVGLSSIVTAAVVPVPVPVAVPSTAAIEELAHIDEITSILTPAIPSIESLTAVTDIAEAKLALLPLAKVSGLLETAAAALFAKTAVTAAECKAVSAAFEGPFLSTTKSYLAAIQKEAIFCSEVVKSVDETVVKDLESFQSAVETYHEKYNVKCGALALSVRDLPAVAVTVTGVPEFNAASTLLETEIASALAGVQHAATLCVV